MKRDHDGALAKQPAIQSRRVGEEAKTGFNCPLRRALRGILRVIAVLHNRQSRANYRLVGTQVVTRLPAMKSTAAAKTAVFASTK